MFYQTSEFENTTGAKYYFAKLLLRTPYSEKRHYVTTDIKGTLMQV